MSIKRMKQLWALSLAACLCLASLPAAHAEEAEDMRVWTLMDESGQLLTQRAAPMSVDDEYIAGDNRLYRVVSADDAAATATARYVGQEPAASGSSVSAFLAAQAESGEGEQKAEEAQSDRKKLIAMYSTHSDESYVPSDGESSKLEDAGIYDVGNALKDNLEKLGVEAVYSEETFHPHDAGAYSRSRVVAEELLEQMPDALIDIHRDAIPKEMYETEVEGDEISMVRLFVGRNNPNASTNREFAKELKAAADEKYPGLIKDIFIGKGNYNQELYPNSILLEFGTHEIEKEKAIDSTQYMADVLNDVLFGGTAQAEGAAPQKEEKNSAVTSGVIWTIVIALIAATVYAFLSTGRGKDTWNKLRRGASEMTGGAVGKGPEDREQK